MGGAEGLAKRVGTALGTGLGRLGPSWWCSQSHSPGGWRVRRCWWSEGVASVVPTSSRSLTF